MGSSRDLAVGTVAVGSLLMASMLGREVNPIENPKLFLHLAFTATFFAGALQLSLGLFRYYFIMFQALNNTPIIKYELFQFAYEKLMNPIFLVVSFFFENYKKNNIYNEF